jgi:hypothetical protein
VPTVQGRLKQGHQARHDAERKQDRRQAENQMPLRPGLGKIPQHGQDAANRHRQGRQRGDHGHDHDAHQPAGGLRSALLQVVCEDRNERGAEGPLAEQLAQEVRHPEGDAVGVHGQAEAVTEHAVAGQARQARNERQAAHGPQMFQE